MVDWTNLGDDVLELLAQRLTHVPDYVNFAAVCVSWRLVAVKNQLPRLHHIPVLMIPRNHQQQQQQQETRGFYSVTERRVYNNFQLSVPPRNCCCGSEYGWVVTLGERHTVSLVNPFSSNKNEIQLPPLTELPVHDDNDFYWECFMQKAVLSSSPSSTLDFVVLAIFGGWQDVAFFRPGDKKWNAIRREGPANTFLYDAIFYKHKFYVVDQCGEVMACDVGDPHPCLRSVTSAAPVEDFWARKYLVESLGDLLQVQRILDWYQPRSEFQDQPEPIESYRTSRFNVYKLDLTRGEWARVKSLGDRMLFIGDNTSLSFSASDVPGCKPNCIYFTDDFEEQYNVEGGAHDFGVFNLEDGIIEPLYPMDSHRSMFLQVIKPEPIWVLPAL